MKLVAKTFAGIEPLLLKEIEGLGGKNCQEATRAVEFEGDETCLYNVLYQSRLATTVLRSLWKFDAKDEHQAYRKAYSCDWSRYFSIDQSFAISASVSSEYFTHSQYIMFKIKDAICDRFRKSYGRRPNVNPKNPDVRLDLRVYQDQFVISLDAAGQPLFKRGYRSEGHRAPLNEILGSAMVSYSGWTPDLPLYDGMCGTGTILLEAAMMAKNIPAQFLRKDFAIMNWPTFKMDVWKEMKERADTGINDTQLQIFGSDKSRDSTFTAFRSARALEIHEEVPFNRRDFFRLKPLENNGTLIINPPYGERMGEDIEPFYERIGDHLKANWKGFSAWLLTSNMEALKHVGLRTSKKIKLYNGPLECRFVKYEMY